MPNLEILHQPAGGNSVETIYQPSVMQLAQAGHFRAIAQWINTYLISQSIYARVAAAPQPGYLLIVVEFQRAPERDRLMRFLCHRICKLNSSVILGIRVIARFINSLHPLWEQSVRLFTPNNRHYRPSLPVPIRRVRKRSHRTANVRTALRAVGQSVGQRFSQAELSLLGKAAVAAFALGCGFEAMKLYMGTTVDKDPYAISYGTSNRPHTVRTANDRVSVTQFGSGINPTDPTVTLTFSGDGALGTLVPPPQATELGLPSVTPGNNTQLVDIALTHLDAPLLPTARPRTPDGSSATTPVSIQTLKNEGVDIVNLASNQVLQDGASGLTRTIRLLERQGIQPVGAGRNRQEARRPEIIDIKGQRIAYLGYSDSTLHTAGRWKAGVNPGLSDQVAADIHAIREQVDWVIVNYHWNQDLTEHPADWQMHLARFAIDQGADLVVGHHPGVLQGAEIYKGRAIAYSLGNFIFDSAHTPNLPTQTDYDTAVLKVSLRPHQMRLEFLPVQVRQAKPQIVGGEKAAEILQHMRDASVGFEQPMESPVTLDARSQTATPTPTPSVAPASPLPDDSLPPIDTPASPSDRSGSFITYPNAPGVKPADTPDKDTPVESSGSAISDPNSPNSSNSAVPPDASTMTDPMSIGLSKFSNFSTYSQPFTTDATPAPLERPDFTHTDVPIEDELGVVPDHTLPQATNSALDASEELPPTTESVLLEQE